MVRLISLAMAVEQVKVYERQIGEDVARLESDVEALDELTEHVQTDEYVEEWAREERGMVKPGDVPIMVVPSSTDAAAQPSDGVNERRPGVWERIRSWFADR